LKEKPFLRKIQNHTNRKTGKKIVLLYAISNFDLGGSSFSFQVQNFEFGDSDFPFFF
jgi:hypothetical protein